MKKGDEVVAKFDSDVGLIVEESIEEQVKKLLKEGFFKGMKAAVIVVSNDTTIEFRKAGPRYECLAMAQYAVSSIGYAYMKEG